jgi:GDP-L-fucose synthase
LIRRYDDAVQTGAAEVTNWGTGTPRRELMHVDDMAAACLHLLENYDGPAQVNVGTGRDSTIQELALAVAAAVGFTGTTHWDTSKPDGMHQKLLDVTQLADAGWTSKIGLADGLASTVEWFRSHRAEIRK